MSASDRKAIAALEYLQVRGYYSTAYTEIVQPERVLAITDYFRRYWVPLLKPGPAWLVVALRQRCYWNSQRAWCTVSRQTLADECGLAVRTIDNYLGSAAVKVAPTPPVGDPVSPVSDSALSVSDPAPAERVPAGDRWIDWFITARRARYTLRGAPRPNGRQAKQRDWTRYTLRLDEPLIPAHQAALAVMAAEIARECPTGPTANRALAIVQGLLDLDAETLWRRLGGGERDGSGMESEPGGPRTIQDIVVQAAVAGPRGAGVPDCPSAPAAPSPPLPPSPSSTPAFAAACEALYQRIVRPDKVHIATQYFRLRWLPLLGPARAWLILHLRARCYLNPLQLEVRDTCTVGGLGELSAVLGVSISTVKACLTEPPAGTFVTHLATHRPAPGDVQMVFRVEMIDPLTPADRERYAAALLGQEPEIAASPADQQPAFAGPPQQEPEFAVSLPGQQPDFAGRQAEQKPESAGPTPTNSQDVQHTKVQRNTYFGENTQQHQVLIRSTNLDLPLAAAAGPLPMILDDLEINEPARSRLIELAPPAMAVIAWAFEALLQERITNKPGFIFAMLSGGLEPPPDLATLAGLSVGRWLAFVRACQESHAAGLAIPSAAGDPHFQTLAARLGHLPVREWPIRLPAVFEPPDAVVALPPSDLPAIPPHLVTASAAAPEPPDAPGNLEPASEMSPAAAVSRARPMDQAALDALWAAVLEQLRWRLDRAAFDAYLRGTHLLAAADERWTVGAPTGSARDWLGGPLALAVEKVAGHVAGRMLEIEFVVLEPG